MGKRGVSVVISSILLILIVVSLFSVVAYFLRRSPEKIMQEGSESFEKMINCDEVDLQIEDVCYGEFTQNDEKKSYFRVTIKNNNNFELKSFRYKLSSGESDIIGPVVLADGEPFIEAYGVKYIDVTSERNINWIKLYPIINGQTCNSKEDKINTEEVKEC